MAILQILWTFDGPSVSRSSTRCLSQVISYYRTSNFIHKKGSWLLKPAFWIAGGGASRARGADGLALFVFPGISCRKVFFLPRPGSLLETPSAHNFSFVQR